MRATHVLILIYLALLASLQARAEWASIDKSVCAAAYLPSLQRAYTYSNEDETFKNCTISCGVVMKCGTVEERWSDWTMDPRGSQIGLQKNVQTFEDCEDQCRISDLIKPSSGLLR